MTDEIDIWRSANVLIQHHGTNAEMIAYHRLDAMRKTGDQQGEAVWRRIIQAIKDLRRMAKATVQNDLQ